MLDTQPVSTETGSDPSGFAPYGMGRGKTQGVCPWVL